MPKTRAEQLAATPDPTIVAAVQAAANDGQSYAFQMIEQDDGSALLIEAAPVARHAGERPAPARVLDGHLAELAGELFRCQLHQRRPDEAARPTWVALADDDRIVASGLYGQAPRVTAHESPQAATQAAL